MVYKSIWEDAIYTVTGMTFFRYNIMADSGTTLIYSGKAYVKPNTNDIEINVARIVQDYLNSSLNPDSFTGNTFATGATVEPYATFDCSLIDEKENVLEEYKFLNCWDYKTKFAIMYGAGMNYPLSNPVNTHNASGMYRFQSVFTKTGHNVQTTISDAIVSNHYCGDGALYYANNLGGWDSLLIEGTINKSESYERYQIQRNYKVDTLEFGRKTICHTSQLSWTLNTHYMTDTESEKFAANVIGTPLAYFHDLKEDKIYPVTIDEKSVEYKQFKSNGRKFAQYSFTITSAQDRQRR